MVHPQCTVVTYQHQLHDCRLPGGRSKSLCGEWFILRLASPSVFQQPSYSQEGKLDTCSAPLADLTV